MKAYEDKIKAQMQRMNESLEQSEKYASEELNPSLKKIITKNKDEVLEVDSEAEQDDSNMLATKSSIKTHLSKQVREKLEEKEHVSKKKHHHHKHSSKSHNELIQLSYNHISHETDTEDIADDVNPSNYDAHHSRAWNDAVEKKALELENEMKIEDNMKLS